MPTIKIVLVVLSLVYDTRSFAPPQHLTKPPSRLSHTDVQDPVAIHSDLLGDITRLRTSDDDDDSFLGTNAVPTFAARGGSGLGVFSNSKSRGLEGVLQQGPAFVVDDILSTETCNALIELFENELGFGEFKAGKNHHGAMQVVVSRDIADRLGQSLSRHVDVAEVNARRLEMNGPDATNQDVRLLYAGLNRRWRVYRYAPGGQDNFAPHIDAGFPPSGLSDDGTQLVWDATHQYGEDVVARLTVLIYLNDDFVGGETKFYQPLVNSYSVDHEVIASVRPKAGSILVFPQAVGEAAVQFARKHWPLHEGSPVVSGIRPKYVIRSDVLFVPNTEMIDMDDPYVKHDLKVRQAFMPQSPVLNTAFLHHVESLYNPHMGVENLGPLLYSWIRFTKVRKVVEIGAGFTSLWILQALRDNDAELERIRQLGRSGECLLLDIPWAVPDRVESYDLERSSLLFVDNCKHQKETATGASAVATTLGLEEYLEFRVGDAFDLELEPASVDLLWCDFGVGSRMADFCSTAWTSLRPGGFLICHSTLTNRGTRSWLEAVRGRKDESLTGLPRDEYVELSLLEPHKRYQNAITILQKRKGSDGIAYEEPIYSTYA
jgi:predicted O-methyltransferase YrrM